MEPTPSWTAALRILRGLRAAGHEAWFAGGAVRDHLLGLSPADVDIATSARPEEVTALHPTGRLVGASFGVVVVPAPEAAIEVATFRTEGPYLDGRRPASVRYGTHEEDARRRDFTINGLYLDPETGEVRDWVDGRRDLEQRRLRAIGDPDRRFEEDHLRLLRAVRFVAQLGLTIEPATRTAIMQHAPRVATVAAERVRDELARMLCGANPSLAIDLLHGLGLLRVILPEVEAMVGVEQPPEYHPEGDVFTHTKDLFLHLQAPSVELAFGALLHDVGKPPTFVAAPDRIRFPRHAKVGADIAAEICARLRFSNESRDRIVALVADHMGFADIEHMRESTRKRFLRREGFSEHLELHRADCLASHRRLDHWEFAVRELARLGPENLSPPRLVTGDDLLAMGWAAGPELGRELAYLEELQLEGELPSRDAALDRARRDLADDPGRTKGPRCGHHGPSA